MAFDARGWRKLVVGTRVFYWQRAAWSDMFHVRYEAEPNRLLSVGQGRCVRDSRLFQGVTPRVVRSAIEFAGVFGWPSERPQLKLFAFGEPWRFIGPDAGWRTPTVLAIAAGIINDLAFDRMPILADAIEEAGCDNTDVLTHCRGTGPHVRGCWVVDLILSKG